MAGLLVSVRSAEEARTALAGGASLIDVKEPARGPLGCANVATWRAVVEAVNDRADVSVALGDLPEWSDPRNIGHSAWAGIGWRKMGLANIQPDQNWRRRWVEVRTRMQGAARWVGVIYVDAPRAVAPAPDAILDAAIETGCAAILFDTYAKGPGLSLVWSDAWANRHTRARAAGLLTVIAGSIDAAMIRRLRHVEPDYFGVRGAVCSGGVRGGVIKRARVEALVAAARGD